MSGGTSGLALPSILVQNRAADSGQTLQIASLVGGGSVGDYFGSNVMTPDQSLAVNLRGADGALSVQRQRVATASTGLYTWTYPVAYGAGVVPIIQVNCEGPDPQNGTVVNAQLEGVPTNTSCKIRVSRSTTTIQVLGINVLSLATAIATTIHLTAIAP